jgi:hypothetical protein
MVSLQSLGLDVSRQKEEEFIQMFSEIFIGKMNEFDKK